MQRHHWIATAILCAAPLFAHAQSQSTPAHISSLSMPGTPPEELAESIIIFVPSVDTPLVTGDADVYLKGKIVKVERGVEPGALVMPANSFTASRPAGLPVRMFLIKHPAQDAYYSIYSTALVDEAVPPLTPDATEISVLVSSPLGAPVHAAPRDGVPYGFAARIRSPDGLQGSADLYIGVMRPGSNATFTWVNAPGRPYLRTGMSPLLEGIALDSEATLDTTELVGAGIEHSFNGDELPGMYTVFALLVVADAAPMDQANWIPVDMKPLFVD